MPTHRHADTEICRSFHLPRTLNARLVDVAAPELAPARPPRPRWLGVRDCARRAGCSCRTVSQALTGWSRTGVGLRYLVRRGAVVRIRPSDLRAWIGAGCPTGPSYDPHPRRTAGREGQC